MYGRNTQITEAPRRLPLGLGRRPDVPTLRCPDGSVVARFSAWGMTYEAVEREALEDLLCARAPKYGHGAVDRFA